MRLKKKPLRSTVKIRRALETIPHGEYCLRFDLDGFGLDGTEETVVCPYIKYRISTCRRYWVTYCMLSRNNITNLDVLERVAKNCKINRGDK
jgi:hypothetical protein